MCAPSGTPSTYLTAIVLNISISLFINSTHSVYHKKRGTCIEINNINLH